MVWLIFRRTRRGALILVAVIFVWVIASTNQMITLDTLKSYIANGLLRYSLIATELQREATNLPWNMAILDGLPADASEIPPLDYIHEIEGLPFPFEMMLNCLPAMVLLMVGTSCCRYPAMTGSLPSLQRSSNFSKTGILDGW